MMNYKFIVNNNSRSQKFIKKSQFSGSASPGYLDWAVSSAFGKTDQPFISPESSSSGFSSAPNPGWGRTPNTYNRPSFEKLEEMKKTEAESLRNSSEFDDLSKTILIERVFDYNLYAVKLELDRLKNAPSSQSKILDWDNKPVKLLDFINKLDRQVKVLENKAQLESQSYYDDMLQSLAGAGVTMDLSPSAEANEWQNPRQLAALERLIRQRQENIEDIDSYVFDLVTGGDFTSFATVAHTNSKFIKIAEEDMVKEADERLEDYINEEMDYAPYGTALEHPQENRNKLTEDIKTHANSKHKSNFRKK